MRIGIIHYHLRRGGVTRVIENTLAALGNEGNEVVVLAEECSGLGEHYQSRFVAVPELRYQTGVDRIDSEILWQRLLDAATKALRGQPDVWHIHNHHLAKNTSLTEAVASMATRGERLLLHIHDFPEDGRGSNYHTLREDLSGGDETRFRERLYPVAGQIFYGVLNRRDFGILSRAGVPDSQIQWLANPVAAPQMTADSQALPELPFDRLTLYPTRAIRRKNLGELLLWAAIASPGEGFACTLAPDNPTARPVYQRWVDRAREWALPVEFEFGTRFSGPFEALVAAADQLITTSVAEGFGLAFLEPWLMGKPLLGRNLPLITADFSEVGLDLAGLYDRIGVPVSWIDQSVLRVRLRETLNRTYQQYNLELSENDVAKTLDALMSSGSIDFGCLDESFQEEIIERLLNDRDCAAALNPSGLDGRVPAARIEHNARVARERFGLDGYRKMLTDCYAGLVEGATSKVEWLDPEAVLSQFLDPSTFTFLRA